MSSMDRADYDRALAEIRKLIKEGSTAQKAADHVTYQFRRAIGDDFAASESLYEEASEFADEQREAACEQADMAELGYGEG